MEATWVFLNIVPVEECVEFITVRYYKQEFLCISCPARCRKLFPFTYKPKECIDPETYKRVLKYREDLWKKTQEGGNDERDGSVS